MKVKTASRQFIGATQKEAKLCMFNAEVDHLMMIEIHQMKIACVFAAYSASETLTRSEMWDER